MPATAVQLRLHADDALAPWGEALLSDAHWALDRAQHRLGLTLEGDVTLRMFGDLNALERFLGSRPTHVLAVAVPDRMTIAILRPAWRATDPAEYRPTLVHEVVHLILARRVAGPLPAWLNEGLAMVAAEERGMGDRLRLTMSGVLGTLLPLDELENTLLLGGERQSLAYAESLSVTRYLLRRSYGGEEDMDSALKTMARQLADPQQGPLLRARLRDPLFRQALDRQWRRRHETFWAWISFLSGTAFLWMATSLLFLLAYWRKRRMTRMIRERFEDEEDSEGPPIAMAAWPPQEDDEDTPPWR